MCSSRPPPDTFAGGTPADLPPALTVGKFMMTDYSQRNLVVNRLLCGDAADRSYDVVFDHGGLRRPSMRRGEQRVEPKKEEHRAVHRDRGRVGFATQLSILDFAGHLADDRVLTALVGRRPGR